MGASLVILAITIHGKSRSESNAGSVRQDLGRLRAFATWFRVVVSSNKLPLRALVREPSRGDLSQRQEKHDNLDLPAVSLYRHVIISSQRSTVRHFC